MKIKYVMNRMAFAVSYRLIGEFLRIFPYVGLIILASWIGKQEAFLVEGQLAASLPILPYIIAAVGCVFAWNFKISTSVLGFLLISLVFWIITSFLPYGRTDDIFGNVLFAGITFLFPLNLMWLCWIEERGVFSKSGFIRAGILFGQYGLLLLLSLFAPTPILNFLEIIFNYKIIGGHWSGWSQLCQPALLAYGISGGFILLKFILVRSPVQIGWFGALAGSYMAFQEAGYLDQVSLYMGMAALMLAIAKIQLSYRLAFLDELTGIPGRRALMSDIKKLGNKYIIAMCDIDHFKKFNDTYGHDIGDQVLCMVAQRLVSVGGGGKAYRYGGEEFAILMPSCKMDDALKHLDHVRQVIEDTEFRIRGQNRPKKQRQGSKARGESGDVDVVTVTISIGAALKSKEHDDPLAVMKSADEALYKAKKKGRNQVST